MTYDRPTDPNDPADPTDPTDPTRTDDTDVVEPQPVVEPEPAGYVPPPAEPVQPVAAVQPVEPVEPVTVVQPAQPVQGPPPAGSQVNVNAAPAAAAAPTYVEPGPGPLYWARRVISLLFAILFVLLGVRIFLLLLVADPNNDIVNFVYSVTEPFVAPFRGMFQFDQVTAGQATLDIAAVAALIGWLLIYVLIMAILRLADPGRRA
jgi:uncharacterized protein YggT (Ycf19 family)